MSRAIPVQFLRQEIEKSLGNVQGLLDDAKILTNSDLTLEDNLKRLICGYLDQVKEWVFESRMSKEEEDRYKKKAKEELKKRQAKRKRKKKGKK